MFFFLSLISVMLNTPKTFKEVPSLKYVTFAVDLICLVFFIAEMVTKIKHVGLLGTEKVQLLRIFFAVLLFFIIVVYCEIY